jgi:glyoxylase-like metal-dependent hydrolase (beta-lactamase superfamily II)
MNECFNALEYGGGIVAIDSGLERPRMAACYLLESDSALAVIEAGHNAAAERILNFIRRRGRRPEDVSHVVVTHVHLDHAGGAGLLMKQLPNATLVAHPRGARHVIDPSRLEASARAVYGDEKFDATYGSLVPVSETRVVTMGDGDSLSVGNRKLLFMDSPGHARHHFTVWDERTRGWFTGDTFGISYRELDTERGPFVFPTTTPVQFDPPALIDSIDRMMERDPEYMYLTHFGRVGDTHRLAADMRICVERFVEFAHQFESDEQRTRRIEAAMMDWFIERAREHGARQEDADLKAVFINDVVLNTQGIEFWLDHGRGKSGAA